MKIDTENTLLIYKILKNQFKILRESVCLNKKKKMLQINNGKGIFRLPEFVSPAWAAVAVSRPRSSKLVVCSW